jgi:hypothetical protein
MFNITWCVCVCVCFFPRCAVMRGMGSLREKSRNCRLDFWGFWYLVMNRKEFHRIFTGIAAEMWYVHLVKSASHRFSNHLLYGPGGHGPLSCGDRTLQDEISGTGGNISSHVKTNVASITLDGIVWSTSMFAVLHHSIETRCLDSSGDNCKHVNIGLGLDMPVLKQQLQSAQINDRSLSNRRLWPHQCRGL